MVVEETQQQSRAEGSGTERPGALEADVGRGTPKAATGVTPMAGDRVPRTAACLTLSTAGKPEGLKVGGTLAQSPRQPRCPWY